jgi:hypothetical protein
MTLAIDRGRESWKGTEYADVVAYLEELGPGGYPVHRVIQGKCACDQTVFRLFVEFEDELVKTACVGCGREGFVSDAGSHWEDASPEALQCPCGRDQFEVALGQSIKDNEWVRWLSVGVRCVACGGLGSPVDWKSDLDLSDPDSERIG